MNSSLPASAFSFRKDDRKLENDRTFVTECYSKFYFAQFERYKKCRASREKNSCLRKRIKWNITQVLLKIFILYI